MRHAEEPIKTRVTSIRPMSVNLPPLPTKTDFNSINFGFNAVVEFKQDNIVIDEGLSNVDAQRIITILNEMERKIQLIDMLPEQNDKKANSIFDLTTISLIKVSSTSTVKN